MGNELTAYKASLQFQKGLFTSVKGACNAAKDAGVMTPALEQKCQQNDFDLQRTEAGLQTIVGQEDQVKNGARSEPEQIQDASKKVRDTFIKIHSPNNRWN